MQDEIICQIKFYQTAWDDMKYFILWKKKTKQKKKDSEFSLIRTSGNCVFQGLNGSATPFQSTTQRNRAHLTVES